MALFLKDKNRYPLLILDDGQMVGCFCLYLNKGYIEYGYSQKDYALIKRDLEAKMGKLMIMAKTRKPLE